MKNLMDYLNKNQGTIIPSAGNGQQFNLLTEQNFPAILLDATLTAENLLGENSQGLLSLSEYSKFERDMNLKKKSSLIADLQSGFGSPLNTYYATKELERSGADILILNDQPFPAHTSNDPQSTSPEDLLGKAKAATDALENPATRLWIKLEGIQNYGFAGIEKRTEYLKNIGVDAIIIDHFQNKELAELADQNLPLPLLATWMPEAPKIDGILGWIDKGLIAQTEKESDLAAIHEIKQGGLAYAKK